MLILKCRSINCYCESIAEKTADVILSSMAGNGEEEATTIIDLLAPLDNDEGDHWWQMLVEVFSDLGVEIEKENIVLSDQGWNSLSNTRILPEIKPGTVISKDVMRSEATYPDCRRFLVRKGSWIRKNLRECLALIPRHFLRITRLQWRPLRKSWLIVLNRWIGMDFGSMLRIYSVGIQNL